MLAEAVVGRGRAGAVADVKGDLSWPPGDLPPVPPPDPSAHARPAPEPGLFDKVMDSPAVRSAMRSAGTVIGREIFRSVFGTGPRRRR